MGIPIEPGPVASLIITRCMPWTIFCTYWFAFPLGRPGHIGQILAWCYYTMVWHCMSMYTMACWIS